MTRKAAVCSDCTYAVTCTDNCEAYMTLARMSINIGDFNSAVEKGEAEDTPKGYLLALEDDLRGLTEI